MAVTVADLIARLRLDTSGFRAGAQEAGRETDKLSGSVGLTLGRIAALSAAFTAAAFAAKKLTEAFTQNALQVRAIQAVSGLAAAEADNLADSFDLLGLDSNALSFAMFRLGQQVDDGGTAIHRMGLTLRDSTGALKTEGALFLEVRDRIASMGTASERSAALVDLFGRAGRQLAPAFALSRKEFDLLMERAAELSPVTEEMQARALEMVQAVNAMAKAWEGFKLQLGDLISRVATPVLTFLSDLILSLRSGKHALDEFAFWNEPGAPPEHPGEPPRRGPGGGGMPFMGRPIFTPEELSAEVKRRTEMMAELELAGAEAKEEAELRALSDAYDELAEVTARVARVREDLESALMDESLQMEELEVEAVRKAWEQSVVDTAEAARRQREEMRQAFEDVFGAVRRGVSGMVTGILQGTQTMEEAFARMGENIAVSLIESIVNRALTQIQDALWNTVLQTLTMQSLFGVGAGALGGETIATAGLAPFMLQEGGITTSNALAVLHPQEAVIPLERLPEVAAGLGRETIGGASVQQVFNVSPGTPEAIRRELWAMMPTFRKAAVDAVIHARNQGGAMARAMGQRRR